MDDGLQVVLHEGLQRDKAQDEKYYDPRKSPNGNSDVHKILVDESIDKNSGLYPLQARPERKKKRICGVPILILGALILFLVVIAVAVGLGVSLSRKR